jgi:hypothetical protein
MAARPVPVMHWTVAPFFILSSPQQHQFRTQQTHDGYTDGLPV